MNKPRFRDLTPAQERQFDYQAEKHFSRQRETPNGRDYRWNTIRHEDFKCGKRTAAQNFREKFDDIFPNSPGVGM